MAIPDNAPKIQNKTVTLTYFKESGKYYMAGTYETKCEYDFQVYSEAADMLRDGENPGLRDFAVRDDEFSVLVQPNGTDGVPYLFASGSLW